MRCEDALTAMHELLDGDAPESLVTQVTAHTQACTSCARAYDQLLHWDQVLREADADQPDDAYFHAMASEISASVRVEEPRPAPVFALSWSFASAMAAACLVLGLGLGHFAFPRTLTRTETVVERVPGPVREVEKVVTREERVPVKVPVEVVRWRTRTVTKVTRVPAEPTSAPAAHTVEAPTLAPRPAARIAEVAVAPTETPAPAPPASSSPPTAHGTYLAALYTGSGGSYADRSLTRDDLSALARRLTDDIGRLDEALSGPTLASALVSDIETVDAEIERAITSEEAEAASP